MWGSRPVARHKTGRSAALALAALGLATLLSACGRRSDLDGGAYGPPPAAPAPTSETPLAGGLPDARLAHDPELDRLPPGLVAHREIDPATGRALLVISNAPIANPVERGPRFAGHGGAWRVHRRFDARGRRYVFGREVRHVHGFESARLHHHGPLIALSPKSQVVGPATPAPTAPTPVTPPVVSPQATAPSNVAPAPAPRTATPPAAQDAPQTSAAVTAFGLTLSPFIWLIAVIFVVVLILMSLLSRRRRRPNRAARSTEAGASG